GVCRQQVPQPRPVRLGGGQRLVRLGDRAAAEGSPGLGQAADPLDGGADVRLAEQVPAAERGPGGEDPNGRGPESLGDDPSDAQSPVPQAGPGRIPLSWSGLTTLIGQTVRKQAWPPHTLTAWHRANRLTLQGCPARS